jgi:NitT/TauT family transport system ATP-binding protein
MHLFPSQMSGGMQQRVSLARAFAVNPDVIFLDEAFAKLDEVTAEALRRDFRELAEASGVTSVIVTHDIDEALFLGTRVIVISKPARVLANMPVPRTPSEISELKSEIVARLRSAHVTNLRARGTGVDGSEALIISEEPDSSKGNF